MNTSSMTARLIASLAAMLLLVGCAQESSKSTDADLGGYYEFRHDGALYVLGNYQSLEQIKAGKVPANTVRSFSSQGETVLFEADSGVLAQRLMAEYQRRHGGPR